MAQTLSAAASPPTLPRRRPLWLRATLTTTLAAAIIAGLLWAFGLWPRSPMDLGRGDNALAAGLLTHWQAGELVVLVRHAERCDRSGNPCLGPADGITRQGGETAAAVGQALKSLGMGHADVLASPLTRTTQTALYMVDRTVPAPQWLADCDASLLANVIAHKVPQRNLVAVTHSGCIGHVEKQLGYPRAASAEYSSALFMTVDEQGKAAVLGVMNVEKWTQALARLKLAQPPSNL
ncbi:lipopolysaccharide core heptose(II)-phosphate phosphatase PmrG [Pseudomonas sp. RIT-To-2]|uniref:lipopolysaccharide core heptose(II)-phosphate phosphatase PmrG n=1 Tax=Pseudomonas sp. RIT-To-2 TaxID=3462541 RepID=UPI0024139F2A